MNSSIIKQIFVYKALLVIAVLVQVMFLSSCGVPKNLRNAIYFKDSITDAERVVTDKPTIIMPGDRLNINITAINKEAADAFNAPQTGGAAGAQGYLVDSAGNIQLLQIGVIHVAGLSPAKLQDTLQQQLVNYIKGPVVTVSIVNFKITVMGEVTNPGTINVPDGKINILQAINQSGDLTVFSNRDSILVIREENGKREFGRVSISSNKIFNSPYYNLQQNDVIYVEPDKTKFINNDVRLQRDIRNLGIATSLLTTAFLVINLFK